MEANKVPSSHFSMEDKRVAVELWKAGVPLKNIREQLKMSERSLRRILAHAKSNPSLPVKKRKIGSGLHTLVESMPRRLEAVIENGGNATKY